MLNVVIKWLIVQPKLRLSPDISLCFRMASLIRSYVTSSVQFTKAFLVMLGNVPEEARKEEQQFLYSSAINHSWVVLSWHKTAVYRHLSRVHVCPRSGRCACRPAWCRCSVEPRRPGSSGLGIEPWPRQWVVRKTLPWRLWCSQPGCGSVHRDLERDGQKHWYTISTSTHLLW